MKKEVLKQRMYFFVPYQFGSTIHAGIQPLHASWHYLKEHGMTKELKQWAFQDETVVVLSGGTSNDEFGTLNATTDDLKKFKIKYATFREPDLGNILTAVSFLVDERVFDKKNYPSVADLEADCNTRVYGDDKDYSFFMQQAIKLEKIGIFDMRNWLFKFPLSK